MKRWADIWSSFPVEHRKRFYQALGVYTVLFALVAVWVALRAQDTLQEWHSRIPATTAPIVSVHLNIQQPTTVTPPGRDAPFVSDGRTYISIIVSNLGLSAKTTEKALQELPRDITFAFSPYAENIQDWVIQSTRLNHETLMLLPMESASYPQDDPGPRAISSRLSDKENDDNLQWLLTQGKGSAGVINFMGSRLLTDQKRLSPIFNTLQKNSAMFIETPGIEKSAAAAVAGQAGLPYLAADLQIDANAADLSIQKQLTELEKIAQERGYAIGIAEPYPMTVNALKAWVNGLEKKGITLAPLSTVWKNKPRHDETAPPSQEQLQQP